MHVITFDDGLYDAGSLRTPHESWTWTLPDSDDSIYLCTAYQGNIATILYYNTQKVWEYEGQHTPESVWNHMTQLLLEHGVVCAPWNPVDLTLTLPDMEASCTSFS